MFASFRRHKWLWAVIFGLTIISFVFFFSPLGQRGGGGGFAGSGKEPVGSIGGNPFTRDEWFETVRESRLRFYFSYRQWASDVRQTDAIDRETRNRLFLVRKLEELDIKVAEGAAAQWIAEAFRDSDQGGFRKDYYDTFVNDLLPQRRLSRDDFERFVRHEVAIEHLVSLNGLPGKLVPPQEAELRFRQENEEVDTQAVFIWRSNYLASVTIDPASVATYYTNQQANYRVPERIRVSYVKFAATNYLAEAESSMSNNTNLTEIIDANYIQRGTNSFFGTNNLALTADAAKEQIRGEIHESYALIEARKKAIDFASELLELEPKTNNLANLAAAKGIVSQVTLPFTQFGRPPGLTVPAEFGTAAFKLTPAQPVHEQPIVAEDAVYMIGYHQRIPSAVPPLESVRLRVTEDYRRSKSTELVNLAGASIHENIANDIAEGKTFEEICTEQQLNLVDLPPFSQKSQSVSGLPSFGSLSALKNAAFALGEHGVSTFTPTQDGGFIVGLQAKLQAADTNVTAELPEYLSNLRRTQNFQAFSSWLSNEIKQSPVILYNEVESAN